MGSKNDPSAPRLPLHRKPKRPLQTFAALVVLSLPSAFGGASAAEILNAAEMKGASCLNSGLPDDTGSMTLRQAKMLPARTKIAGAGHEVAGHTCSHPDIDTLDLDEAKREICQDRENPRSLGFQVTSFFKLPCWMEKQQAEAG